jgi:hypothetical protein
MTTTSSFMSTFSPLAVPVVPFLRSAVVLV